jgi:hypothetical protein
MAGRLVQGKKNLHSLAREEVRHLLLVLVTRIQSVPGHGKIRLRSFLPTSGRCHGWLRPPTHGPALEDQNPFRINPLRHSQIVGPRASELEPLSREAPWVRCSLNALPSFRKRAECSTQPPHQVQAPSSTGFSEEGKGDILCGLRLQPNLKPFHIRLLAMRGNPVASIIFELPGKFSAVSIISEGSIVNSPS